MLRNIFASEISVPEKLKRAMKYTAQRRGAEKAWKQRHQIVFRNHPGYLKSAGQDIENTYRKLWKPFRRRANPATLRICHAISAKADPYTVPEDIFQSDIEPSLNFHEEAHYLSHKSLYRHHIDAEAFPADLFNIIDGEIFNGDMERITRSDAERLLSRDSGPVVCKPNFRSYGGSGIQFFDHPDDLAHELEHMDNVVVQKRLKQSPVFSAYNPKSLNTVRVYLYRSVVDNTIHILNTSLRMGVDSLKDNVTTGGLISRINIGGHLNGYALGRYGKKYDRHPISGLKFDLQIPDYGKLCRLAERIMDKLFLLRIAGLDLYYDEHSEWKVLEINTKGHSIRMSQYAGVPFFGEYTREVISYCRDHHWALK